MDWTQVVCVLLGTSCKKKQLQGAFTQLASQLVYRSPMKSNTAVILASLSGGVCLARQPLTPASKSSKSGSTGVIRIDFSWVDSANTRGVDHALDPPGRLKH